MKHLFKTRIGRLRILGFLEGMSLIILIFIAMPIKYLANDPAFVKALGPVHGALFIWFILVTASVSIEERWEFSKTTLKVLVSCLIPFGNFYVDKAILKPAEEKQRKGY
jgi:integral membrane protein